MLQLCFYFVLTGNISSARKVTVSANATEKDSVFGDAVHIVITT